MIYYFFASFASLRDFGKDKIMKIYSYTTTLILFLITSVCLAQQKTITNTLPDTAIANQFFSKAKKLFKQAKYDSSIAYFEKASIIYHKEKLIKKYVQCYNRIGKNFSVKGEYQKALSYINKALEIGINKLGERDLVVAESYHNLGIADYFQGNYGKSLELYNKSLSLMIKKLGEKNHA